MDNATRSRRSGLDFEGHYPPSPDPHTVDALPARFLAKVQVDDNGCWRWTASRTPAGYGRIGRGRRGEGWTIAHRFAYEHVFGPVPDGLELDHLCRVRHCANPWHVEPVTHAENVARGRQGNGAGRCRAGRHQWTSDNIYVEGDGIQRCRPCRQEWERQQSEGVAPALRTHCPHGHPYAGDNLHIRPNGDRHCRACHRERERRRYHERKKAGA
jgi:hypothetical protein